MKKNGYKKQEGITLIALVITIIVLIILASIATYSGKDTINSSKLVVFTAELKIMQTEVNNLYDAYKNGRTIKVNEQEYLGEEILNIGQDISSVSEQATNSLNGANISDNTGYRYFDISTIKGLQIDGVQSEFFVNVSTRSVVSYEGFKDGNKMYYTIEQVPDNLYNVQKSKENSGQPTFDVNCKKIENGKWRIEIPESSIVYEEGYINKWNVKYKLVEDENWSNSDSLSFVVMEPGLYDVVIFNENIESAMQKIATNTAPEQWEVTVASDSEWYDFGGDKIEEPNLKGEMLPIKYVGEVQDGNKWANAITADGSMWVWIPRYAYKITEGYHTETAGKIEVAFINTSNQFLNGETGTITTDPSEEGAGTTTWLVHPAFTANAANGGGFGEIKGIWMGKFEATGTITELTVKPGEISLTSVTPNQSYQLAKNSTYGESNNETVKSHMAKNSEWGAAAYLSYSRYGTTQKLTKNTDNDYRTGGTADIVSIYTENKNQSTTYNATGIYDMCGGAWEYVASYVDNKKAELSNYGGSNSGDLYGSTENEQTTSTAYKTVYTDLDGGTSDAEANQQKNYEEASKFKGDAIYETSGTHLSWSGAWFGAYSRFPYYIYPFFVRGGSKSQSAGRFYFYYSAPSHASGSFRPVIAILPD